MRGMGRGDASRPERSRVNQPATRILFGESYDTWDSFFRLDTYLSKFLNFKVELYHCRFTDLTKFFESRIYRLYKWVLNI